MIGKGEAKARQMIEDAGFQVKVYYSSDTTAKKGRVFDQTPSGGETADADSTVVINVSTYEEPTTEPTTEEPTTEPTTDPTELPTDLPTVGDEQRPGGPPTGSPTGPKAPRAQVGRVAGSGSPAWWLSSRWAWRS